MNPDAVPERLEELLSLLLHRKVKILQVLPNEGSRIASENSLLIMDIVIEMSDGSIANVEVQKQNNEIMKRDAQIEHLNKTVDQLTSQIHQLTEQLSLLLSNNS